MDKRREIQIDLAIVIGEVINAVIVGIECAPTSGFDVEAALEHITVLDAESVAAALVVIAEMCNERGIMPHELYERAPHYIAQVALADL